ncbi:MAG: hypothetical protein N3E36_02910 [Sulfolobales archaeon]|nr:hypothetical protein [Sulfolobales archaeon]MCX8198965.1 hypothetical protein [Sulfolobales archaeon]MDW8169944.1 hypothetical protein [Desulfurococcaceae archaeon]
MGNVVGVATYFIRISGNYGGISLSLPATCRLRLVLLSSKAIHGASQDLYG